MICEVANCRKDVQASFPTGLQEILAMRIHLARDHQIFRDTAQILENRHDQEQATPLQPSKTLVINTDDPRLEKYLG
jgi:hypothetical protein